MMNLINRFRESLAHDGVLTTAARVGRYPFDRLKEMYFTCKVLKQQSVEETFSWIYRNNYWGSEESVSGPGSTLDATRNLRAELPRLIERFAVKSMLDAPCGDFQWMRLVLQEVKVTYMGGDIVKAIINAHNLQHANTSTSFVHIDLIREPLPQADLLICRDCLFHFSYADTRLMLENFLRSDIAYLLTTTHTPAGSFQNRDINTGEGRRIDLFSAPYHFPHDPLARIDDWVAPFPERQMCLWSREQVRAAIARFGQTVPSTPA